MLKIVPKGRFCLSLMSQFYMWHIIMGTIKIIMSHNICPTGNNWEKYGYQCVYQCNASQS